MPKVTDRLTAIQVKNLNVDGLHPDGNGLYLKVAGGSKSWVLRYMLNRRARYLGLGSASSVRLGKARELASKARELVRQGIDPIEHRKNERAQAKLAEATGLTFRQCAEALIESHESAWKNAKHRQQWRNTLATYAYPEIGNLPVSSVDTEQVLKILQPIWTAKPETASRVRGRIEAVLDWAKARGARQGENCARWRGHLDHLLPKRSKVARVKHHPAMPFAEIPAFMVELRERTEIAARGLEFLILTACRTGEVLGARWDEVDLGSRAWLVPGARTKTGKEHRVPLAPAAIVLLNAMAEIKLNEFVFPGMKQGRPLSDMALLMLLRRMGRSEITGHGFRSSFRDWAAERTNSPNHVVEMALAHAVSDKVEAAYRRGDLFAKRRKLMEAWASYCARG